MKKSTRRLPTAPVEIDGKTFSIPAPQNGKMEGCVRVLKEALSPVCQKPHLMGIHEVRFYIHAASAVSCCRVIRFYTVCSVRSGCPA